MGTKPASHDPKGEVTHGICGACQKKQDAEIDKLNKEHK